MVYHHNIFVFTDEAHYSLLEFIVALTFPGTRRSDSFPMVYLTKFRLDKSSLYLKSKLSVLLMLAGKREHSDTRDKVFALFWMIQKTLANKSADVTTLLNWTTINLLVKFF